MTQQMPEDAVGRRVFCDGERGTVRYVGTVPPTTGLWLGVEWDNPDRGKHDGSHEGVCYFTCRHPTGGSFVRPKKVSFGVNFLTAVKLRYELCLDEALGEEVKISTKTVKMVGFESIMEKQRMDNLTEIALVNCEVSGPGPENEIKKNTPNAVSLDMSGNLLSSWEVIAAITEQLKELQCLCLRWVFTHLSIYPPTIPFIHPSIHPYIHLFVLEVLCLRETAIAPGQHLSIHQSFLLSFLFHGECLCLNIKHYIAECCSSILRSEFIYLFLFLFCSQWAVISELEKLKSLVQLSCLRNPLMDLEKNRETTHQLLIACISQLKIHGLSQVLQEERRGAELDYCKKYGRAWLQAGGHRDPEKNHPSAEFLAEHPRYLTLIQKYGAPEEDELKEQKPFALKDQLLTVTFECPEDTDRKPIQKKLPSSMMVQKVKGLLYRLLKLPGTELHLSYTSSKIEGKEVEIHNDLKSLQFYSIEDGDRILVRWS
uniref:Tubulin-specific chaperone E n=1 Tax=Astyanax mexicanus TaxID=7994 RepID=A0A8B9KV61_ASTMX